MEMPKAFKELLEWLRRVSRIRRNKKIFGKFFQECSCPKCHSWNFNWFLHFIWPQPQPPVKFKCLDCGHSYESMVVLYGNTLIRS